MTVALVVVGMSVREVNERDVLERAAAPYGGSVAFLQQGDPSLGAELTRLADSGVRRVRLVGASLGTMAPANSWLRRIAAHWWREREDPPVVEVATAMMRSDADLDLVLDVTRPIAGTEVGLTSGAWEAVPPYRHHVLVCRGPRCSAQGADRAAEELARELRRRGLSDDEVLVAQTGCLYPCNHAPVVAVQPDGRWLGEVTADRVSALVDSLAVPAEAASRVSAEHELGPMAQEPGEDPGRFRHCDSTGPTGRPTKPDTDLGTPTTRGANPEEDP